MCVLSLRHACWAYRNTSPCALVLWTGPSVINSGQKTNNVRMMLNAVFTVIISPNLLKIWIVQKSKRDADAMVVAAPPATLSPMEVRASLVRPYRERLSECP